MSSKTTIYPQAINGRYILINPVGKGSYGTVYLAYDKERKENCAVKVYFNKAFSDYPPVILRHRNLVKIRERLISDSCFCEIMPYYSFGSIDKFAGCFSEQMVWRLMRDVSAGLSCLHDNGKYHLDIKPANILLDDDATFVICDYSISVPSTFSRTYESAFEAPRGFSDSEKDIWALGVTAYYMVTGEMPFMPKLANSTHSISVAYSILKDRVSTNLANLICSCFTLAPTLRPDARRIQSAETWVHEWNIDDALSDYDVRFLGFFYSRIYSLEAYKTLKRVVVTVNEGKYGVTDKSGKVLVDFVFDFISDFREVYWPGPGPIRDGRLGAFFEVGEFVGLLEIASDGSIRECERATREEYRRLQTLT